MNIGKIKICRKNKSQIDSFEIFFNYARTSAKVSPHSPSLPPKKIKKLKRFCNNKFQFDKQN